MIWNRGWDAIRILLHRLGQTRGKVWFGVAALVVVTAIGAWLISRGRPTEAPATPAPAATPLPTLALTPSVTAAAPSPAASNTAAPARPSATLSRTSTPAASPTITPSPTPRLLAYTIKAGDTLSGLAEKYESPMSGIAEASGIKVDALLRIGQVITIPLPASTPTPSPQPTPLPTLPNAFETPFGMVVLPTLEPDFIVYEVLAGDTLSSISEEFNVKVEHIIATNNMTDPSLLSIGQELRIPLRPPTATPLPTPRRLPSPTAGPRYPAPALLSPADGEALRGADGGLPLLVWSAVGILGEDEFYLARLWNGQAPAGKLLAEEWTKATSWRAPADLAPAGANAPQSYYWTVIVARRTGRPGDYVWTQLSAQSISRAFTWRP